MWQQNLNEFMTYGFERSLDDPCVYKFVQGERVLYCGVHVDDLLCAYNDRELFEDFHKAMNNRFKCKESEVGYLKMEVTRDRDRGTVTLSQSTYIEKVYAKYLSQGNTKAWITPINTSRDGLKAFTSLKLAETDAERNAVAGKDIKA